MSAETRTHDKAQRILEAAIKVFARHGFYNSKVSEIAREAQVADGTIYLYFKNKDDILISLFEDRMTWMINRLKERLEGVTEPIEKIRRYIRSHFEIMRDNPDLAIVTTLELRQSEKFMRQYRNKPFALYLRMVADMIREGKEKGLIRRSISSAALARALFGMLDELSLLIALFPKQNKPEEVEKQIQEIADFFIRGIAKEGVTLPKEAPGAPRRATPPVDE